MLSLLFFFLGRVFLEKLLGDFSKYIFILGGSFIIIVGVLVSLGKRLEFRPWQFLQKNIVERDKKSIIIIGLIIGLLPCAPFLAILSYIGLVSKTWVESLWYVLAFGLGTLVSPLVLLTLLAGLISYRLQNKKYYQIFSFICGSIIIFLGIQLVIKVF